MYSTGLALRRPRLKAAALFPFAACLIAASQARADGIDITRLSVPDGFRIEVVTNAVPGARQMALGSNGTLFVGSWRGALYAIPDPHAPEPTVIVIDRNLPRPSGVAVAGDNLFVGASQTILRYPGIESRLDDPPEPSVVIGDLPDGRSHRTKYLRFGPDGRLYLPIGAPCNACESRDERFATLLALDVQTGTTEIYARGVRSSVGFDWHPTTGQL